MTVFINTETGQYPVYQGDIQQLYPSMSFSIPFIPPRPFEPVAVTPQPSTTFNQKAIQRGVEQVDGVWKQVWEVVELTPSELQIKNNIIAGAVRRRRDDLLSATDWTQVEDAAADKQAFKAYRHELRNISSQVGFPQEIIWPEPPTGFNPDTIRGR